MIDYKATRDAVGEALIEKGLTNDRIVVLTADLKESTRVNLFAEKFTERFFDCGVAEQAMVTIASGMANYGKIPFITSFAVFVPGRTWEQIRTSICLNDVPVKIIGGHTGLSAVLDGGNHQMLEDIALMRSLPNIVVIVPADYLETKKAVIEAVGNRKPTYIRVVREATAVFTTPKSSFKIGKAEVLFETRNPQVTIIACGPLVYEALVAAKQLEKSGIDTLVINNHTVKPMDERTIIHAAKITGAVVTVEEHQVMGGMGSAVAEVLAKNFPVPMEFIGMPDSFGESGKYDELLKKYGLTAKNIVEAVKKVIIRKNV
jgi:transketolase